LNLNDVDWSVVRGSLIVLLVSAGISGALIYGGYAVAADAELKQRRDNGRFQAARVRYLTLDDEKRLIEEFAPQFAKLEEAGLIGDERRLSWVETLRTVAQGMKMPSLRYEISSQEKYKTEFEVPQGVFGVYSTEMRLKMGLLHGGDLGAVFAAMSAASRGLFTVTGCSVVRQVTRVTDDLNPSRPNLSADCRLEWMVTRKLEPQT
jgi:hypothetical protein